MRQMHSFSESQNGNNCLLIPFAIICLAKKKEEALQTQASPGKKIEKKKLQIIHT